MSMSGRHYKMSRPDDIFIFGVIKRKEEIIAYFLKVQLIEPINTERTSILRAHFCSDHALDKACRRCSFICLLIIFSDMHSSHRHSKDWF